MQAAVAISYFHRKIGPMVYYCYPETALEEDQRAHIADIMDQSYEESYFTHKFGALTSINYYFEIYSEWARGNKEMLMISFVVDSNLNSETETLIVDYCKAFIEKLKKNREIFKAFYEIDDKNVEVTDRPKIKEFQQFLRFWVKELYWMGFEELRERTEEEKWAAIMAKPEIFNVIRKLSKGPLALEDIKKWFKTVFPQNDLKSILDKLEQEKFIFINSIGQDTYVLLVKDVSIMRVPPDCVIDLEEESPDSADLTEIYINEVRDFFESYSPTPPDALVLFKLFANPKIYNVISQLREGPLPKEKIYSMVSEDSMKELLKNLEYLKEYNIIQPFSYSGMSLFLLKTDVVLTANFPEYLKRLLPKKTKDYKAQPYAHKPLSSSESETESLPFEMFGKDFDKIEENDNFKKPKFPDERKSLHKDSKKQNTDENKKLPYNTNGERHQHKDYTRESEDTKNLISRLQKDLLKKLGNNQKLNESPDEN